MTRATAFRLNGQRACALAGFVLLAFFGVGMILAHYLPPPGARSRSRSSFPVNVAELNPATTADAVALAAGA